jgi:hypothetical protein
MTKKKKLTAVQLSTLLSYAAVGSVGYCGGPCGCLIDVAVGRHRYDRRRADSDLEQAAWHSDLYFPRRMAPETILRVMEKAGLA